MLQDVNKMLQEKQMSLSVTRPVCDKLVELGYDKRWVQDHCAERFKSRLRTRLLTFALSIRPLKTLRPK